MTAKQVESVWDYPCPPRLEAFKGTVKVIAGGITIAESTGSYRMLETSHPPVYYIPMEDIASEHLKKTDQSSVKQFHTQRRDTETFFKSSVGRKMNGSNIFYDENPKEQPETEAVKL